MLNNIKNFLRYTKFHFFILRFTNPNYLKWLSKEISFHKKFLRKNDQLIFDLGANMGDKSHIFLNFSKKIILYEPEEKYVKKLKYRFRKYKKVQIKDNVVYDKVCTIDFYSVKGHEGHSSILKGYSDNYDHLKNSEIIVKKKITTTLNKEIDFYGKPYYCKIDCEGSEEKILKNLNHKIEIISFEANLPKFYENTINIINTFREKFNSSFNLRKDYEYNFFLDDNVSAQEIKKILFEKKYVFEVFIFS